MCRRRRRHGRTQEAARQRRRSEYWYQHPLHYAVRGGHLEAVQLLLDAGGDPEWNAYDGTLAAMARDRGHEEVATLLDGACKERGRVAPNGDHPIHHFAARGETGNLRTYLDADATLIDLGDKDGATPLHHAARCGRRDAIVLLLDRGANIHAALGGFLATELQPIDLAIWGNNPLAPRTGDIKTARLLLDRGAAARPRSRSELAGSGGDPGRRAQNGRGDGRPRTRGVAPRARRRSQWIPRFGRYGYWLSLGGVAPADDGARWTTRSDGRRNPEAR